jgi:hypothetical protein
MESVDRRLTELDTWLRAPAQRSLKFSIRFSSGKRHYR